MKDSHIIAVVYLFFFNETATTEIYTLSLHVALPIYGQGDDRPARRRPSGRAARSVACPVDRKSTRLNSSHPSSSYAVLCLRKKTRGRVPTPRKIRRKRSPQRLVSSKAERACCRKQGVVSAFFFFNDPATTKIYTLSLHDALPIPAEPRHRVPRSQRIPQPKRDRDQQLVAGDRKSTRLNSSHPSISYAVFCLK